MKYYKSRDSKDTRVWKVDPDMSWYCYCSEWGLLGKRDAPKAWYKNKVKKWSEIDTKVCIEISEEEAFIMVMA